MEKGKTKINQNNSSLEENIQNFYFQIKYRIVNFYL